MVLRPMLARGGPIPRGDNWVFELKWDGFRALVSTEGGRLLVRSRRGWNMTQRLPGLERLPADVVLDGEIVAFNEAGVPHFPLVCSRLLHGEAAIALTYVAFDLLRVEGLDVMRQPWNERRRILEELDLGPHGLLAETFDDGQALFQAVVDQGLEGIVAKRRRAPYRPGYRGWVKIKNPDYWRRKSEVEGFRRSPARGVADAKS